MLQSICDSKIAYNKDLKFKKYTMTKKRFGNITPCANIK